MPAYIAFTLYGPLQAWGEAAVGEIRGTASRPTKSGVLGLVAAALGIARDDDTAMAALHRDFAFSVRIDSPGEPLHDYHTTQSPVSRKGAVWPTRQRELAAVSLNTILSTRHYRADACYTIALRIRGGADPEQIVRAFRSPAYALFLGRRSCPPALPIRPVLIEAEDLEQAFAQVPVPSALEGLRPGTRIFYEDGDSAGRRLFLHQRNDRLLSSTRRTFAKRFEHEASLAPPEED